MRNKNGKRVRVEPSGRAAESVVAKHRFGRRSPSSSTSSLASSCLSTMEEMKEEVASSWIEEPPVMVVTGCRRCFMYVLVSQARLCCPKCKCNDLILF
ncbi:protein GL2-INTERACTING REPRESSOR 2 [Raphanus sativus]|uniref:Protein GL2-INTERACTING REPRESSOR 2 n=1 Tax=Raphanus sativus TaxID=3726 RepID=A0A6J0LIM0_RAPSA|nr:protein GL2-INTERACTING REPRESSOR 2 [Raphanus sativus]